MRHCLQLLLTLGMGALVACRSPLADHLRTPAFPDADTVDLVYLDRDTGDTLHLIWIRLEGGDRLFIGGGMQDTWPDLPSGLFRPRRLDLYLEGEAVSWRGEPVPFVLALPLPGTHTSWQEDEVLTVRGRLHRLDRSGQVRFSSTTGNALFHRWVDTLRVDGHVVSRELWEGTYTYGAGWDTLRWVREGELDTLQLRLKRLN